MISVLFIGSIQLLSIGIIGEYVGRIQADVRKRPHYIVSYDNMDDASNANIQLRLNVKWFTKNN
jgi:polyisoprenyl-phosphate glycosyltransferase